MKGKMIQNYAYFKLLQTFANTLKELSRDTLYTS